MNLPFNWEVLFETAYRCRWVHLECDKPADPELDSQLKEEYVCTYCRHLAEMDVLQTGGALEMGHHIPAGTLGPASLREAAVVVTGGCRLPGVALWRPTPRLVSP